jgi:hypothetical protein
MNYDYLILMVVVIWYGLFLARMIFVLKFKKKIKNGQTHIKKELPFVIFALSFIFLFFTILSILILKFFVIASFAIALIFYFVTKEENILYLDMEKYGAFKGRYFAPSVKWCNKKSFPKIFDAVLLFGSFFLLIVFIIFDLLIK